MSKGNQFERNTLLRLRRQYSKDEAVKFISAQLSAAQHEIGVLKSEKAEIEDTLNTRIEALESEKIELYDRLRDANGLSQISNDPRYVAIRARLKACIRERKRLRRNLTKWQEIAASVKAKLIETQNLNS